MNYPSTADEVNFWAWADTDLHAMPAARVWVVELCPPIGDPFTTRVSVTAGYLGQGEATAALNHCANFYPDHMIGEFWPIN
jgi:hypothetical protein